MPENAGITAGTDKFAMLVCLVSRVQVDAADERRKAVDDQDFAMVAIVWMIGATGLQRIDRIVFENQTARGAQRLEELGRRVHRAIAVVQDIDGHALCPFGDEKGVEMLAAAFDVLEGIKFQIDRFLRVANGVEHRRKGFATIVQDDGVIAGDQRRTRHSLLDRQMTIENIAVRRLTLQCVEYFSATRRTKRPMRAEYGL